MADFHITKLSEERFMLAESADQLGMVVDWQGLILALAEYLKGEANNPIDEREWTFYRHLGATIGGLISSIAYLSPAQHIKVPMKSIAATTKAGIDSDYEAIEKATKHMIGKALGSNYYQFQL